MFRILEATPIAHQRDQSKALKAARQGAGFSTAAAAAVHFGWSVSRYRSHEGGTRRFSHEDVRVYADAFGVRQKQLLEPNPRIIESQLASARKKTKAQREQVARRLRAARILRGYQTGVDAARDLDLAVPTYLKHEAGDNGLGTELLDFYSTAFVVSRVWLEAGHPPSGLGNVVDDRLEEVLCAPEKYVSDAPRRRVAAAHDNLPIALRSGRPRRAVRIPEYLWSELERQDADRKGLRPSGVVQLPGVHQSETVGRGDIFSVLADDLGQPLRRNSRIFVDGSPEYWPGEEYLLKAASGLRVDRLGREQLERLARDRLVGRVIGRLEAMTFSAEP